MVFTKPNDVRRNSLLSCADLAPLNIGTQVVKAAAAAPHDKASAKPSAAVLRLPACPKMAVRAKAGCSPLQAFAAQNAAELLRPSHWHACRLTDQANVCGQRGPRRAESTPLLVHVTGRPSDGLLLGL